jgi:hypothetical protein
LNCSVDARLAFEPENLGVPIHQVEN